MSVQLFGTRWPSPVYLSAVSGQRAFHPDAEVGAARAAASRSALMMLSSFASNSTADVIVARGAPVWQQIYPTDDWSVTREIVGRAQRLGFRRDNARAWTSSRLLNNTAMIRSTTPMTD